MTLLGISHDVDLEAVLAALQPVARQGIDDACSLVTRWQNGTMTRTLVSPMFTHPPQRGVSKPGA